MRAAPVTGPQARARLRRCASRETQCSPMPPASLKPSLPTVDEPGDALSSDRTSRRGEICFLLRASARTHRAVISITRGERSSSVRHPRQHRRARGDARGSAGAGSYVVVVGGDAVPGPFAGATVARLEALSVPTRWIRGNGEREVAAAVGGSTPADDDLAARTAAVTAPELGADRARALGELPLTLELDGYCHASPRRDHEMLTRLSSSKR